MYAQHTANQMGELDLEGRQLADHLENTGTVRDNLERLTSPFSSSRSATFRNLPPLYFVLTACSLVFLGRF